MEIGSPSGLSREGLEFDEMNIPSPPAQIKYLDILAQDVTCKIGMELLITPYTGRVACVYSDHVEKLISRGWVESQNYVPETRGGGGGGFTISGSGQD